jgi:hypothetical protein
MVSVYHLDGDRLMMTHFCSSGNQPRVAAQPPKNATDPIVFTFVDVTNLKAEQKGHISALTLISNGPDQLTARWSSREIATGKDTSFDFSWKRVK